MSCNCPAKPGEPCPLELATAVDRSIARSRAEALPILDVDVPKDATRLRLLIDADGKIVVQWQLVGSVQHVTIAAEREPQ